MFRSAAVPELWTLGVTQRKYETNKTTNKNESNITCSTSHRICSVHRLLTSPRQIRRQRPQPTQETYRVLKKEDGIQFAIQGKCVRRFRDILHLTLWVHSY